MRRTFFVFALLSIAGCGAVPLTSNSDGGDGSIGSQSPPVRSCSTTFTFAGSAQSVQVGGEWNKFDPTQTPMSAPVQGNTWRVDVALPPGNYAYKLVVDGNWIEDPQNPYEKAIGGVWNSVVEVDDCNTPQVKFVAMNKSADGAIHLDTQYIDGHSAAGLDPNATTVTLDGMPFMPEISPSGVLTIETTGLAKNKHRITINAVDKAGHAADRFDVPFWIEDEPFDFRDGIMYFAFTDRFVNGDPSNDSPTGTVDPRANYEGGDFAGIKQKIDAGYFDSLGVRTIWISPPNANPDNGELGTGNYLYTGYHGYWPTAGRETQKRFGDLDSLKALVQAAHSHGIRVLVDGVLNHVHIQNPLYQQHASDGWFNGDGSCVCGAANCDWTVHALDCWFEPYLPDLNYQSFDAMKTMIDDALFWAREVDVDGYRVDAVKHFYHAATRRLRSKLRDEFEHVEPLYYLVGETFDGDRNLIESFIGPNELIAQFDFPIYFVLVNALGYYSQTMRDLESATAQSDQTFGSAPMSPFMGNHDVPRFTTIAAGMLSSDPSGQAWTAPPGDPPDDSAYQKLQLAQTFVVTSPGVPLLYYGDEFGMPGAADPDNRRFMKWDSYSQSQQNSINHLKALGAARKELIALRRGNRLTLWVDDDLYVYARVSNNDVAIVVINRNWNPRTVTVPVPSNVPLANGTVLNDRLGGPPVTVTANGLVLNLAGHSSAVLAP